MRINSFLPGCDATVEFDGYVPMIARVKGDFQFPPNYWRTGDFKQSLVEIGVDKSTGAICKVAVVSLNKLHNDAAEKADLDSIGLGLPCVKTDAWNNSTIRIDVEQEVSASLIDDRLVIQFGSVETHFRNAVRCGRLVFQVGDENILCGIEVTDLSPKEIENFRYSIM